MTDNGTLILDGNQKYVYNVPMYCEISKWSLQGSCLDQHQSQIWNLTSAKTCFSFTYVKRVYILKVSCLSPSSDDRPGLMSDTAS